MAPVVLQLMTPSNDSAPISCIPVPEHQGTYSPAVDPHTPSSPAAEPLAVDTVYRLHRVSPYRYVDTPLSSRYKSTARSTRHHQ
jgi:hypothetical protein